MVGSALFPFRPEEPIQVHVIPPSVPLAKLAEYPFPPESCLFIERDGSLIVVDDRQGQAMEVEFIKGVLQRQSQGLSAIALAPVVWLAKAHGQHGRPVVPLNGVQGYEAY